MENRRQQDPPNHRNKRCNNSLGFNYRVSGLIQLQPKLL